MTFMAPQIQVSDEPELAAAPSAASWQLRVGRRRCLEICWQTLEPHLSIPKKEEIPQATACQVILSLIGLPELSGLRGTSGASYSHLASRNGAGDELRRPKAISHPLLLPSSRRLLRPLKRP